MRMGCTGSAFAWESRLLQVATGVVAAAGSPVVVQAGHWLPALVRRELKGWSRGLRLACGLRHARLAVRLGG